MQLINQIALDETLTKFVGESESGDIEIRIERRGRVVSKVVLTDVQWKELRGFMDNLMVLRLNRLRRGRDRRRRSGSADQQMGGS